MKGLAPCFCLLLLLLVRSIPAAWAGESLRSFDWESLRHEINITAGEVLPGDSGKVKSMLKVNNSGSTPATITILTIENPQITAPIYALEGLVRYQGVEGNGYLELWNHFPGGARYYTRTAAKSGPMQYLSGSSKWRRFVLPFYQPNGGEHPRMLELNIVLPGRGTVWIGPLRLMQYAANEDPLAVTGRWWNDRTGGIMGILLGVTCGLLAALGGILAGKGKAQSLVMVIFRTELALGILMLALGIAARLYSQPYSIWYPMLLVGGILTVVTLVLLPVVARQYQNLELRKMKAMDVS